ncbi:MAG: lysostaphin resistance A-like protein [Pyrinomonadaceae bacterium]
MDTPTDARADFSSDLIGFGDDSSRLAHGASPPTPAVIDPDRPPWGVLVALGLTASIFVFQIVVQIVFVVPYALTFRTTDPQALVKILTGDKAILLSILAIIPAHLLTLGLAWMIVTSFGKRPFWDSLGWGWSPRLGWLEAAACLGLSLLLLGAGHAFAKVFGDPETQLERMILSSTAARYTVAALATFTAPLVEEVVFRGVLYSALRKRVGVVWGACIVILIFAAIHVPQYLPNVAAISTILLLSSVLTIIRARSGRLLPCVAIHFFFNGITSVLIVVSPYFEHTTTPSPAPPPTTPPGVLIELLSHAARHLF